MRGGELDAKITFVCSLALYLGKIIACAVFHNRVVIEIEDEDCCT